MRRRALLLANVVAFVGFALDLRGDGVGPSRWGWDLTIVRAGARLLLEGRSPYDAAEQARVLAEAMRPELARFPFAYPPFTAIVAAPLALAPVWLALILVTGLSVAILFSAARHLREDASAALWVTASFPGVAALFAGQLTYFSLGLFAACYVLSRRGRSFGAGLCASLLAFKPTMLVAVPVALAVRPGRARALAGLAAGVAGQLAMSFVIAPSVTRAYPEAARRFSSFVREHPDRFDSVTWRASFAAVGSAGAPLALTAVVACFAAGVLLMWRWRGDLELVFATCIFTTLACAWHCLPYDYVLVGLAAWVLHDRLSESQRGARLAALLVLASWIVVPIVTPAWRKAVLALYPPVLVATAAWTLRAARAGEGTAQFSGSP